jgi:hypothetical protein
MLRQQKIQSKKSTHKRIHLSSIWKKILTVKIRNQSFTQDFN